MTERLQESDGPRIRPARPDDYEPWLAEKVRRGEIEPPDELVIEDRKLRDD